MKNAIKPLAKRVLIPLGLTAAASAADSEIHRTILGSGEITLIILNDKMKDIIKTGGVSEKELEKQFKMKQRTKKRIS